MLILTDFIKREAARDMATPYLLVIDEGWKLIESPGGLGFVAEAFRDFSQIQRRHLVYKPKLSGLFGR